MDLVLQLKDDLDQRAQDARVDTETKLVRPHRDGLLVDAWASLEAIERAHRTGATRAELVAERTPARRTLSDLHDVRMDAVLGTFETRYNPTEKAEDRTFNLRVAASRIDGLVLMPGEELDFNEVVGERSEANGFRVAPVIAAGELVDGIGGGTCQISGTLHAAVFFAGLPIIERRPHSRPSFYIKLGLDAAVSYPSLNFRFRNDRDFPIVIGFTVDGGVARATIWGARHETMVSFVRRVDETMAFEERETEDPSLPRGTRVLSQRGIPGFELARWRVVRDPRTNQAVREAMEDTYPPTTQIWRVGTGGAAPPEWQPPPDDEHPEYTADEYLELTQGAGIDGTQEVRRAGRTGAPGWTVAAGYTDSLSGTGAIGN
jgi:vancomycin resistance protein YoaR